MTYKWRLTTHYAIFGGWRIHRSTDFETLRDAEKVGRDYAAGQTGYSNQRKSEISGIKTGRIKSVYYQDSFLGLICWEYDQTEKGGHERPAKDVFTAESFDRLIARYHEIFDLDPPFFRRIRTDLPPTGDLRDPETLAEIRAVLPEEIVSFHLASFHMDDLTLYQMSGAVFDWLEKEYREDAGLFVILTYNLDHGDFAPWDNRVFDTRREMTETAKKYRLTGQGYRLTPVDNSDFTYGSRERQS